MSEKNSGIPFQYFPNNIVRIKDKNLKDLEFYKQKALILQKLEKSKIYLIECLLNSKKLKIRKKIKLFNKKMRKMSNQ